jgi:hypothetical protein
MTNLDFYAVDDDLRELLSFIYADTDIVVFESYSEYDRELRQFDSVAEIEAIHTLGTHLALHLQLWSPSVMKRPIVRRIELDVPGHTFRYAVEGAGLMQLYLDGVKDGVIYHSHFGCWSEAGARERSIHPADDCDWRALSRVSGQIQRHVRRRMAGAKLYARPVLRHAVGAVRQGLRLFFAGTTYDGASSEFTK